MLSAEERERWYRGRKQINLRLTEPVARRWKQLIEKTEGATTSDKIEKILDLCETEGEGTSESRSEDHRLKLGTDTGNIFH